MKMGKVDTWKGVVRRGSKRHVGGVRRWKAEKGGSGGSE